MVKVPLKEFVDQKRVRDAIVRAEKATDAPIAVSIAPHVKGDVHEEALRALHRRGLSRTQDRHAVLFFVVPSRREFAVVGDQNAHASLGQAVWESVVATVEQQFRAGNPTAGLVAGIEEVGQHLAQHFPRKSPTTG